MKKPISSKFFNYLTQRGRHEVTKLCGVSNRNFDYWRSGITVPLPKHAAKIIVDAKGDLTFDDLYFLELLKAKKDAQRG